MELDQRRKLRSRKPLSDLRNIDTRLSSQSSSSPTQTSSKVKAYKSFKSSTNDAHVNNVTTAHIHLNYAPPASYPTPSTPSPASSSWVSVKGNADVELWGTSSVYSRRKTTDKSKTEGRAVPESLIIMTKTEGKREDIGGNSLGTTSKATPKKKQRRLPAEPALLQEFIDNQRAYFHEVDLESLSVEEICSDAELE